MLKSELNMFTGNRTMVKFLHLKIFIVFSSFPFILGDSKQNRSTAVGIDHGDTDGHNFLKKIVHGDKMSERPGYLVFTAPYKLCEGGCEADSGDFFMSFPLFVGKKGSEVYKSMYPRDFENVHSKRPNVPFRQQTTRVPFTTCPPVTTTVSTTTEATTKEPTTTEAATTAPITRESTTTESTTAKSLSTESATTTPTLSDLKTDLLINVPTHSTTPTTTSTNIPKLLSTTDLRETTCPEVVPRICRKRKKMLLRSLTQTTFCPDMFPLLCRAQTATASLEIKKVDD